ncbi:uncharacterized protein M421DRAFT_418276 [Didymella exigua CBS 183.55]|uniref:Uncharacterized protein n=1 Tax=Didymella exigua CBS 183.55 TaxID=1150837 RepID=A0A6A5RWY6_9PLEO|nr:uncharacterized protein M421DRAFT_418276 [Didymella exigua CBS 183.55]KAF1930796.1 hypothetical protein M421DRAFT_418276 [Didymella exigua CBS 183.55]
MAPTPVNNLSAEPLATSEPDESYWKPANIAFTAVASALALGIILAVIAFLVYRHRQHKKINRSIPAKESLLEGDERKLSMFSRERASSVTVYVDNANTENAYKRVSQKPTPLAPLRVSTHTPVPTASAGSGISELSRHSNSTLGTMMLSPGSEGSRPSRPQSTSTSSVRYYAVIPTDITTPVPKTIRTVSD